MYVQGMRDASRTLINGTQLHNSTPLCPLPPQAQSAERPDAEDEVLQLVSSARAVGTLAAFKAPLGIEVRGFHDLKLAAGADALTM